MHLQSLNLLRPMVKERHLQEKALFDLDFKGSKLYKMLPSTLDIMQPMHQQSLMLLHLMVQEKLHLQENTLFDGTQNFAQCPLHHVTYVPIEFDVTCTTSERL